MHQDHTHHYLGSPNENISLDSSSPNSGSLQMSFDGNVLGSLPLTVQFSPNAGVTKDLIATLTGPPGSFCVVSIATVDGGTDVAALNVKDGDFHDSLIFEFVTIDATATAFIARAIAPKPAKKAARERRGA